jgi:hypothetical protein
MSSDLYGCSTRTDAAGVCWTADFIIRSFDREAGIDGRLLKLMDGESLTEVSAC